MTEEQQSKYFELILQYSHLRYARDQDKAWKKWDRLLREYDPVHYEDIFGKK